MKINVMIREPSPEASLAAEQALEYIVTGLGADAVYTQTTSAQRTTVCVLETRNPAELQAVTRGAANISVLLPAMSAADFERAGFIAQPATARDSLPRAACA